MNATPSRLGERGGNLRAEAATVGAALALIVASVAFAARILLHEPLPPARSALAGPAGAGAGGVAGSLLFDDPAVLALAARSADVLFGIAAAPSGEVEVLVRTREPEPPPARALRARVVPRGALQPVPCGRGCVRLAAGALRGTPVRLELSLVRPGRPDARARFDLPAALPPSGRALAATVQAAMGSLRSVHVEETLTAGLAPPLRTVYDFAAPDRIRLRTSAGERVVIVGKRRYDLEGGRWVESRFPGTRSPAYIWEGASRPRLLGEAQVGGERVKVLALFLPRRDFPAWFRLYVRPDGRVLRADMLAPSHFMVDRFSRFDAPVSIGAPR